MAGPQPNIQLRNRPSDFNLSFGKNIFTLEETDGATNIFIISSSISML